MVLFCVYKSVAVVVCKMHASGLTAVNDFYTEAAGIIAVLVIIGAVKTLTAGAVYLAVPTSWTVVSVPFVDLLSALTAGYVCHSFFSLLLLNLFFIKIIVGFPRGGASATLTFVLLGLAVCLRQIGFGSV